MLQSRNRRVVGDETAPQERSSEPSSPRVLRRCLARCQVKSGRRLSSPREGHLGESAIASFHPARRSRRAVRTSRNYTRESRETSPTSTAEGWIGPGSHRHNPVVHVGEESNSGIVPAKLPNRAGREGRGGGGGRPGTNGTATPTDSVRESKCPDCVVRGRVTEECLLRCSFRGQTPRGVTSKVGTVCSSPAGRGLCGGWLVAAILPRPVSPRAGRGEACLILHRSWLPFLRSPHGEVLIVGD